MSDSEREPRLDTCGCCEGAHVDEPVRNAPGLPALRYRVGTHGRFLERMLANLPLAGAVEPPALDNLTTRTPSDPTVALLDAAAEVTDILAFYQERIANEGYLRTATERRSVLELARAIGYELAPGVAASVQLSFTVEDAPGAPGVCAIPKGTQIQSVPPQGKDPQVFETSEDFTAKAQWNALRPRLTRPAELAIVNEGSPPGKRLCLVGPVGSFPPNTTPPPRTVDIENVRRIDSTASDAPKVDAVDVSRIYLAETAPNLAKGERVLFVGKQGTGVEVLILRIADVVPEAKEKRIRVDLEPLPDPVALKPVPIGLKLFPIIAQLASKFAPVSLSKVVLDGPKVETAVLSKTWRERDLQAFMGIQKWEAKSVLQTVATKPPPPAITPETGAFAFRDTVAFFGHNAPRWGSLPHSEPPDKNDPYPKGWDGGDKKDGTLPRRIWTDSQDAAFPGGEDVNLERPVNGIVQKSWIVIESPNTPASAYSVYDAREASRADFGLSGRAMALRLTEPNGAAPNKEKDFRFRTSTARANSVRLDLADLPIASPIPAGSTSIELDTMVLGLAVGQAVILQGERSDLVGVETAEVAVLSEVVHGGGRTTINVEKGLTFSYVREKLTINANAVAATHGETVTKEVLGSGDAAVPNQQFTLKKPPLTYVTAPTTRGIASSLDVRVNGVKWEDVPSLYGVGPQREAYVVRIDDDARASVTFGDGGEGARLPSGSVNVSATYRSGIGPDGEVPAGSLTILRTMPLGLRGVTNAIPAAGAEGPERLADARRNAPRTVLTFERVVSLTDYEDFARTFPGIGKALADRLCVAGRDFVHLTVAGATGGEPAAEVLSNLRKAIASASDGAQPFVLNPFSQRYFTIGALVEIDPRRIVVDVLAAAEQRVAEAFGFESRQFGQSVTAAEVIALLQHVDGIVAVDLEALDPYDEDGPAQVAVSGLPTSRAIPARRARWNEGTRAFDPAELLLVNPVGIDLNLPTGAKP